MPTVLIVDDDEDIRYSLDALLAGEGYEVVLADGGTYALEWLRQHPGLAVVLFDYLMPDGDGLNLLRHVAADEALVRRYAFICMAARPHRLLPEAFQTVMEQLAVTFMTKPFDVDEVLALVREAQLRLAQASLPDTPFHTPPSD